MKFDAVLGEGPGGVTIPFDVRETFGASRVPVVARLNGVEYRTTIVKMGGEWVIPVRREIRERAGVELGDRVTVELERDDAPRTVDLPPALAERLDPEARAFFDSLSFTHRREYVEWITSAKREETRQRRLDKAVELLRGRVKTPG
jgi:bifunctional DNA-binding transcriptional regulator/antitoxin component of YhaV-PrlF toxin-antitoxin module